MYKVAALLSLLATSAALAPQPRLTARRLTTPRTTPVAASLVGTRWTLSLDVGPEKGTWMPPTWGRSGARATPRVRVEFADDGAVRLLEAGPYDKRTVEWDDVGGWSLDGETVRFWLPHKGLQRDDVVLEPGKIWFNAPAWGPLLSRRGNLTIKRSRLGWIPFLPTLPGTQGSFMVGTFRSVKLEEGDPPLGGV